MHEYAVTIEFWIQNEDLAEDEVKARFLEVLSRYDFTPADVSGWDIVGIEALS